VSAPLLIPGSDAAKSPAERRIDEVTAKDKTLRENPEAAQARHEEYSRQVAELVKCRYALPVPVSFMLAVAM